MQPQSEKDHENDMKRRLFGMALLLYAYFSTLFGILAIKQGAKTGNEVMEIAGGIVICILPVLITMMYFFYVIHNPFLDD